MKKLMKLSVIAVCLMMFTSCYTHQYSVGAGAQKGISVKKKNHFVIYGLAPVVVSDPQKMAKGAKDFDVKTSHTFIDGVINMLTFGIYNPTTTKVTR
ncbi:Bor family protein [Tenacibaculum piscium]|uniref:Bor family protein n=1 Tax=Tenacibaculum piscium TaxID=1458515 RepID=UPI001F365220|nr:Bor family protein [Tenacibaculum piscium]